MDLTDSLIHQGLHVGHGQRKQGKVEVGKNRALNAQLHRGQTHRPVCWWPRSLGRKRKIVPLPSDSPA